ncbi:DNA recombination protein RmuC [Sanyastnella coralliicola]|uniref:DNA recombination protein RmuC n=1 Tax=Sanyastnella coralliicola TaxID=3069118 RepID=UPI0027B8B3DE|nr:DNA recombination protein RmuC [Longitalea sp. SCSIO 12813]
MDLLALLIGLLIGLVLGVIIAILLKRGKTNDAPLIGRLESEIASSQDKIEEAHGAFLREQKEHQNTRNQATQLEAENHFLKQSAVAQEESFKEQRGKLEEELKQMRENLRDQFKNLANEILDEKSKKFTELNSTKMGEILDPLKTEISGFKKRVEEVYNEENKERHLLKHKIDELQALNERLSSDAENLTKALKGDSKTQGDWGEAQLEVILEKAGLQKETHYQTQTVLADDEGKKKKPDFVINLPEEKQLIIDAKVSLTAYERFHAAETDDERNAALKGHIDSIRAHIKELGTKDYEKLYEINSPDFVLMFVPIEAALFLALNNERDLYEEALKRNVVIVSTTTLLATMRTVRYIWTQEDQRNNIREIVKQVELLYNKFRGFTQDLQKVGKSMEDGNKAYTAAMNKLSEGKGNLISRVERIRSMSGYKPKDPIEKGLLDKAMDSDQLPQDQAYENE